MSAPQRLGADPISRLQSSVTSVTNSVLRSPPSVLRFLRFLLFKSFRVFRVFRGPTLRPLSPVL